jgi:hypothetical protein
MNQTYAENGDYPVVTLLNSTLLPVRVDNLHKSKKLRWWQNQIWYSKRGKSVGS